jgi:hypothetical protein
VTTDNLLTNHKPNRGCPPLLVLPQQGLTALPWLPAVARSAGAILCPCEETEDAARRLPDIPVLAYTPGNLTPARRDLLAQRETLTGLLDHPPLLVRDRDDPRSQDAFVSWLRLMGVPRYVDLSQDGRLEVTLPPLPKPDRVRSMLLKTCGGIGNVVLTTHLASAALRQGWTVYFCPLFDEPGFASLANLFENSGLKNFHVLRPEEVGRVKADLHLNIEAKTLSDERDLCHNPYRVGVPGRDADFNTEFFFNVTGLRATVAETFVGEALNPMDERLKGRIVVCPGSKRGWDSKRWPHMDALLRQLPDPVVLCREEDLNAYRELDFLHPITAPNAEYVTNLNLADAAALLRHARLVVANDCGLAHMAVAAGTSTLILFGPSDLEKNFHDRPNARYLHLGLDCQPCQGKTSGPGYLTFRGYGCARDFHCLAQLKPEQILQELSQMDHSLSNS